MPFNTTEVAKQIEQSRRGVQAEARARQDAIALALKIYREADETAWEQRVQDASARRWVGEPLSPLHEQSSARISAPDYSVVATDSSFIAPDKHRGAMSYLINVGRVMVSYGDQPAAEIDNTPNHYSDLLVEGEEAMSGRVLQAKCALRELHELYAWADLYRPDLALLDGSLMQLVLVLSKEEHVEALMADYFRTLRAFHDIRVPIIGYISLPESQMVMRAIRMLACDKPVPCEKQPDPDDPCGCRPLWTINDADLFWEMLDANQRSPIFGPEFSHLVGSNAPDIKQMVFAYLGTQYETARLEFPAWVWEEGLLERAISITLHQSLLGRGYPNCLTLAHQFAALHNVDRESYYFLLERAGLLTKTSEKAHGKRMIGQAI
ncbi:MAG: DNA double-strand break repair nuclease NurA [Chloroflexia bacterium]